MSVRKLITRPWRPQGPLRWCVRRVDLQLLFTDIKKEMYCIFLDKEIQAVINFSGLDPEPWFFFCEKETFSFFQWNKKGADALSYRLVGNIYYLTNQGECAKFPLLHAQQSNTHFLAAGWWWKKNVVCLTGLSAGVDKAHTSPLIKAHIVMVIAQITYSTWVCVCRLNMLLKKHNKWK